MTLTTDLNRGKAKGTTRYSNMHKYTVPLKHCFEMSYRQSWGLDNISINIFFQFALKGENKQLKQMLLDKYM